MEKITISLEPGDRDLIDKIIASDQLEDVRTPEQALLWSLKIGKLVLDKLQELTKPANKQDMPMVSDRFSVPGIPPVPAPSPFEWPGIPPVLAPSPKVSVPFSETEIEPVLAQSPAFRLLLDMPGINSESASSHLDLPDLDPG